MTTHLETIVFVKNTRKVLALGADDGFVDVERFAAALDLRVEIAAGIEQSKPYPYVRAWKMMPVIRLTR